MKDEATAVQVDGPLAEHDQLLEAKILCFHGQPFIMEIHISL